MNNGVTFSSELKNVLDELGKRMGVLIDWTKENVIPQITDLLHRITLYEIYTSIAWIVFSLMVFGLGATCYSKDEKWKAEGVAAIIGCFLMFFAFIIIMVQTFDIIKACTIPEEIWIDKIQYYISRYK